MYSITFCSKCRGLRVGWNSRYLRHGLICKGWATRSLKILGLAGILSALIFAFSIPSGVAFSGPNLETPNGQIAEAVIETLPDPLVHSIEMLLRNHQSDEQQRTRIAQAVVQSGRKYKVDPRLVASIIIVESRANPFAISENNSVGIMQIHVPTWKEIADRENINLFKVEDNIDFGVRILKKYTAQYGLWDGVMRYKGWNGSSDSAQNALAYVEKVKRIYQPQTAVQTASTAPVSE